MKLGLFTILAFLMSIFTLQVFSQESHSEIKNYQGSPLTSLQYQVTKKSGTEPAFHNEYWNNHQSGIYVDVLSGEALFTSIDKFDSGTGWPSFVKPLQKKSIVEKLDRLYGVERVEVRSSRSNTHLGHVFKDGPAERGGLRYCINSAALRFIPKEKLLEEGYGKYLGLFRE